MNTKISSEANEAKTISIYTGDQSNRKPLADTDGHTKDIVSGTYPSGWIYVGPSLSPKCNPPSCNKRGKCNNEPQLGR